jgi:prepilin-type N-terminal cleavage/methylation domain-containing protein
VEETFQMQPPFLKEHMEQKTIRGFTLIELLVVIAIIAILAGLLFPAGQSALNSAFKTTAKNQCVQIATAITAYEAEYGRLPNFSNNILDSTNLGMLRNGDTTNNPRGLNFIELVPWKKGRGGTNEGVGSFLDPWSNAYSVSLDTNYSNDQSNVTLGGGFGSTNLKKHIMVWSTPKVGKTNVLINSWD